MEEKLIAPCGIYCRLCEHYFAGTKEGESLKKMAGIGQRAQLSCTGCQSADAAGLYRHCRVCGIRPCAQEKGVLLCSRCVHFPCEKIEPFCHDGYPHHQYAYAAMRAFSGTKAQWAAQMETRWRCAHCGAPFAYYEKVCRTCGEPLDGLPERQTQS